MLLKFKICILFFFLFQGVYAQNFDYSVNTALRNEIRKQVWSELKIKTPQKQRVALNFSFLGNSLFNQYNAAAKMYNYNPANFITATTFLKVISGEILAGKNYSKAEINKIYETTQASLEKSNFKSEKELQLASDKLILTSMWLYSLKGMMKNDISSLKKIAKTYSEANVSASEKYLDEHQSNSKEKPVEVENTSTNPMSDIYDIRMRTINSYGLSGPYIANKVYVLYKNGDLYKSPTYPLESFNIKASKKKHPNKWEKWKDNNGGIIITYKNRGKTKQTEIKKWFDVRAITENHKLNGVYETLDPFGGSTVVKSKIIYFDTSGKFAWKTVSGGTFSGTSVYHKSKARGTYHINKHTIIFTFESGKKESYFFALYPKKNNYFIIGSSHFVPLK